MIVTVELPWLVFTLRLGRDITAGEASAPEVVELGAETERLPVGFAGAHREDDE